MDSGANFLIAANTTIDAKALFNIALVNIFLVSRLKIINFYGSASQRDRYILLIICSLFFLFTIGVFHIPVNEKNTSFFLYFKPPF